MATKFTATAPDGSEISFSSANRTYTHAILSRLTEEAVTTAGAYDHGRSREWKLLARVGRPELVDGALRNAEKYNRAHRVVCDESGDARDEVFGRAFDLVVVPVVAVEKKARKAVAAARTVQNWSDPGLAAAVNRQGREWPANERD